MVRGKGSSHNTKLVGDTSAGESLEITHIELSGKIAPGWKLVKTLPVSVQLDEDGQYLLTDDLFSIFGEGGSISEAQQDLITSLIEYYELVAQYEDEPSQKLLVMMRKYLQPI
jgi:hypothetical protein